MIPLLSQEWWCGPRLHARQYTEALRLTLKVTIRAVPRNGQWRFINIYVDKFTYLIKL